MSKYHEWGDCSFCPRKRPDFPIKRIRFLYADSKELVCDFCFGILKEEGKKRGEEICSICFEKAKQNRTVILEDFFKPVNGNCFRCDKKENKKENNREEDGNNSNKDERNNKESNDISKIFNICAGCQKDISQQTSYYLPGEKLTRHWCANCYPKNDNSANSVPTKQTNNQTNLKCYNCKKHFNYGDNTHYFPQEPNKKWCDACNPEIKICLQVTQQIFQNQEVNVDNLNISTENKEQLRSLAKIKKGEQVDIDLLNIDQEAKEELKTIQKQINPPPPKITNPSYKYISVCSDCQQDMEYHSKIPSRCGNCQSKNIKVYNDKGQKQVLSTDNLTDNNPYLSWIVGGVVTFILLIPYFIWRKKKKKELEKQGKKMPWYY